MRTKETGETIFESEKMITKILLNKNEDMAFILCEGAITQFDVETEDIENTIKLSDSTIIDY